MEKVVNIMSVIENEISVVEAKQMAILHKGEIYKFFDEGTTRHVFVNDDTTKVIKILKCGTGFNYNIQEAKIYADANENDKVNMIETTIFNGVIEQDFCTPIKYGGKKLTTEERNFAISCRNEVGWANDGRLVCFDLDEYKKH